MPEGRRPKELETIVRGQDFTPDELVEAIDAWSRADGTRPTRAVAALLIASGLAQSWEQFSQYLSIELYTDPEEPDPATRSYPIARVLDWNTLHNAIPSSVGKSALGLFVYARALGDRGFLVCLSDLIEGMEPNTQRIVHDANALRFGLPPLQRRDRY
jgi:hypothetical protein